MSFLPRQEPFTCEHCGAAVEPLEQGTCRSHCPLCLFSKHVDIHPGDRASVCRGLMEPVGIDQTGKKGLVVIHRCTRCKVVKRNKAAPDDQIIEFMERNANAGDVRAR